jgi:hypothetical protein
MGQAIGNGPVEIVDLPMKNEVIPSINSCLVVTGTWLDDEFPETVGKFIIPTDEVHHFSEG